jgi:lipopolysaccharide transport system ATP-binding protein
MHPVISIENLSKKYILKHQNQERYTALRDVLANGIKDFTNRLAHPFSAPKNCSAQEEFWALKDVDLNIKHGDRVGVIGRNGAGKSTLLKILSRITDPTSGRIKIRGRLASLLEVGAGFHPELTGRENIFLNGAILGMSRAEITAKFDEIVAFAEVERFLDTPVKRYSSGMYVRLAFAVAAHLEPEILIVDEVLAVGDVQFQKKCLGKMNEVGKEGRTVIFVSHNMNAIEQLCTRGIVLEKGRIVADSADMRAVIKGYLTDHNGQQGVNRWTNAGDEFPNPWFKPLSCCITDENERPLESPVSNSIDIWVQIEGEVEQSDPALTMGYALYSEDGNLLYWSYQTDANEKKWPQLKPGVNRMRSRIPARFLNEGTYRLEVIGGLHFRQWLCEPGINAPYIAFQILGGLSDSPYWLAKRPGILAPVMDWEIC